MTYVAGTAVKHVQDVNGLQIIIGCIPTATLLVKEENRVESIECLKGPENLFSRSAVYCDGWVTNMRSSAKVAKVHITNGMQDLCLYSLDYSLFTILRWAGLLLEALQKVTI